MKLNFIKIIQYLFILNGLLLLLVILLGLIRFISGYECEGFGKQSVGKDCLVLNERGVYVNEKFYNQEDKL